MSDTANIPGNVIRFEVLLYASLVIDSLSAALLGDTGDLTGPEASVVKFVAAILIIVLFLCVWLAARHRRNWARWIVIGAAALSAISLVDVLGQQGFDPGTGIDMLSLALTAAGLYFSFTGDARGWFDSSNPPTLPRA